MTATTKYTPFPPVHLIDRQWPARSITQAPIWMSTDLRDGNQALFEPMNAEKKMRMFKTLCAIGFKEIEIAFPSASETEFGFVRNLIEGGHIPDDVTIEVLTQAREHLIRRTFESLKGARQAIVHVYNATCKTFRDNVFGMSKAEVVKMAVDAVKLIKTLAEAMPETKITLQYSPELFTATELDFAKEVCDAVTEAWGATPERKVILNLPTTVESPPQHFADQISGCTKPRPPRQRAVDSFIRNDRGTAVAADSA
jgi:2-isopropylmalate synthase